MAYPDPIRWESNSFIYFGSFKESAKLERGISLCDRDKDLINILTSSSIKSALPPHSHLYFYGLQEIIKLVWLNTGAATWTIARSVQALTEMSATCPQLLQDELYLTTRNVASHGNPGAPVLQLSVDYRSDEAEERFYLKVADDIYIGIVEFLDDRLPKRYTDMVFEKAIRTLQGLIEIPEDEVTYSVPGVYLQIYNRGHLDLATIIQSLETLRQNIPQQWGDHPAGLHIRIQTDHQFSLVLINLGALSLGGASDTQQ